MYFQKMNITFLDIEEEGWSLFSSCTAGSGVPLNNKKSKQYLSWKLSTIPVRLDFLKGGQVFIFFKSQI